MKEKIQKVIKKIFNIRNFVGFIASLILLGIILYKKFIISEDALFWTFSTIVQSFVALLALLGMVAIYRLQSLEGELSHLCETTRSYVEYFKGPPARAYTHEEIITECKKISEGSLIVSGVEINHIKRTTERLNQIIGHKKKIRVDIHDFIEITIFIIFISLVFLPWTPVIAKHGSGLFFLIIVLISAIYSLLSAMRLIKTIL